uniref:Uncharacterized protein n=1 Tax=Rhizophora mucronata TaxID=61149 RepID=A0A2P2J315_RHIMU
MYESQIGTRYSASITIFGAECVDQVMFGNRKQAYNLKVYMLLFK